MPQPPGSPDEACLQQILQEVSRTFALTIPQLPPVLERVVGNAYLLCRIADTVEDSCGMDNENKRELFRRFIRLVEEERDDRRAPGAFAEALAERLSPATPASERELAQSIPKVLQVTSGFPAVQRRALGRCIRIMADGMFRYQERDTRLGVADLAAMNDYCYHVAGVVGEMLTELFCDYSADIAEHREKLMPLAVEFGQGLQMTNILKDVWEDRERGACWLPRSVFAAAGYDLSRLRPGETAPGYRAGMIRLIGAAHGCLRNGLRYTLLIPPRHRRIRRFALAALGMAVLTLRRIHANPSFRSGREVKISRRSVRATMLTVHLCSGRDRILRGLFDAASKTLSGAGECESIGPISGADEESRRRSPIFQ